MNLNGRVEELRFLRDDSDVSAIFDRIDVVEILTVDHNGAAGRVVVAEEQMDDR